MSHRFTAVLARASVIAALGALALTAVSTAAGTMPTLNVALTGASAITVSGSTVSGAVNIVSTFSGKPPAGSNGPGYGIVRLNPGVTFQQAAGAVQSHHGELNALTPYGTLLVDAGAPARIQTILTPGNYVALNITGNGRPVATQFTVTPASSPAALPQASATETAIEFAFHGPTVLHNGTIVRAQNEGWLVHMIDLIGVPSKRVGHKVMALLRAGKDGAAMKLIGNSPFFSLIGPASPGGMQQQVLQTRPGYYVQACFMDTGDHREHTRLGMLRLVQVVK